LDVPENIGIPYERIIIDIAGPFPESKKRSQYLLIAMDYLNGWLDFYTVPNKIIHGGWYLVTNYFHFWVPR
jgi:hypothetical protein